MARAYIGMAIRSPELFPLEKGVHRHLQAVQRGPCIGVDEGSGDRRAQLLDVV